MIDAASVKWSKERVREHYKKTAAVDITVKIDNIKLDNLKFSYKDIETIAGKANLTTFHTLGIWRHII